jgi:putative DeoR family transcriptional regulator (stage III sporulation protein D)
MQEHIRRRVLDISEYIIKSSATVRHTAKVFGVSKSTVHKDMTERLPQIDKELAEQVRKVLAVNKAERHIRGGEATRQKYRGKTGMDEAAASSEP